jgi:hypothetical protein
LVRIVHPHGGHVWSPMRRLGLTSIAARAQAFLITRLRTRRARRRCDRDGHAWEKVRTIPPLSFAHYHDRCRRCGEWRGVPPHFEITLDD